MALLIIFSLIFSPFLHLEMSIQENWSEPKLYYCSSPKGQISQQENKGEVNLEEYYGMICIISSAIFSILQKNSPKCIEFL